MKNYKNDKILKNNKLRLLIAGNKTRFAHLKQFIMELEKIGIESKLIYDIEFIDKFLQVNIKKKIEKDRNLASLLKKNFKDHKNIKIINNDIINIIENKNLGQNIIVFGFMLTIFFVKLPYPGPISKTVLFSLMLPMLIIFLTIF